MAENEAVYRGTGKRKTSVARVILTPGSGAFTCNGRALETTSRARPCRTTGARRR